MSLANANEGHAQQLLQLEIKVEYKGGPDHTIQVLLTNKGKSSFECLKANLPWNSRSLTLLLVPQNARQTQLTYQSGAFCDLPSPAVVQVNPNETLKGAISLKKEGYPNIAQTLAKDGIDVFWAYELNSLDGKVSNRMGGWFEIAKSANAGR